MIDSRTRYFFVALDFAPSKRLVFDVEDPAVVHGFVSDVSPENNQEGFGVGERVPISFTWRFRTHVDHVPYSYSFPQVQMIKIVGG